ncbi:hypothetical protein ABZP36_013278 [Zizania latifolia]
MEVERRLRDIGARFGSLPSADEEMLRLIEDEIERIRHEFDDAKHNYLSIPVAIKDMPKMNPQGIYVNKHVKLDDLQVYGFDYDSHYSEHLQCLIYDLAKKHLVNEVGKLSNGDSLDMPPHDESAILSNDATIKDTEFMIEGLDCFPGSVTYDSGDKIMLADKQSSLEKLE